MPPHKDLKLELLYNDEKNSQMEVIFNIFTTTGAIPGNKRVFTYSNCSRSRMV